MRTITKAAVALTAGAVALAPIAAANAATKPHAKFAVTKLSVIRPDVVRNVANADAVVKAQVQVKDFDKKFDPKSVKLVVVEKVSGTPVDTFTVKAKLVGRSGIVSNWLAAITVPKGSVAVDTTSTFCLSLVKVDPTSTAALPAVATAKGLAGRDCFAVTNKVVAPRGR